MRYYQNYCVECDWAASKKDHSTHELASLAIDHAVSTGHDIDSRRVGDGSDTDSEVGGGRSKKVAGPIEYD